MRYEALTEEQYRAINARLGSLDTLEVLKWAYGQFGDKLVYACSFGVEGIVLIDLISKVRPDAKIIFLDTHVHFKETYELIVRVQNRYPALQIEFIEPNLTLTGQAAIYGDELWKSNPNLCCQMRKVEPLAQALSGADAWMSGLRREQSPTRAHVQYFNKDDKFRSIKICPLIHWTWDDIWEYVHAHNLTYNELHDRGYPSIGCETCTRPVAGIDSSRAGRWAGSGKTECGLHQ
ncbi:phosphoadenylyl-sulfate reductase [Paenibacillus sp. J2TS4]|uniref:phosphoadenylyl-sulfate reductase n=1 Tax=Paenibacillus sp. J2TS4 TaxID=2807194 RepID=UPI001BCE95DA|nr:phosphoadenylyl-sulfate reductase [Paenibacillus sp. J2TS4]